MSEDVRDCSCSNNWGCNQGELLNSIFGGWGCGNDNTILFFIIVFLLLFTNFGCCCNR